MSILGGLGKAKLAGKKELTIAKPLTILKASEYIYIPLVGGMSTKFDVHVEVGSRVKVGTKLATREDMYVPLYATVSGVVEAFEKRMHVSGKLQEHIVIKNDFMDEKDPAFTFKDVNQMSSGEIVDAIKEMGMVGLGGSGFPTYIKYNGANPIDTIVINAVECEPYITSDYMLIKQEAEALFDGVELLITAAKAKRAIIALKRGKKELYDKLMEKEANYPRIEVREVSDAYPLGWERTLISELFRKQYDRFPGEIGVIVNNATTAISISKALRYHEPLTHRIVTMSGEGIKYPQNVLVAVGTPVNYIIEQIGGYADVDEVVVLNGGPMMGKSIAMDTFVINTNSNAITVLPYREKEELPCLRCGLCTITCPAKIQPVQIMNALKRQDFGQLEKLSTLRCVECKSCSFVCPSKIEVSDYVSQAKKQLMKLKK